MSGYRNCAGIILFNDEGKVLMCTRKDRRQNQWQFPQGGIEEGEKPHCAALRELKEETSVTSAQLILSLRYPLTYNFPPNILKALRAKGRMNIGQRMYWFLIHFTGKDSEINLNTTEPEFRTYEWTDISNAPKRIIYFKRAVYRKVCKIFKPYIEAYIARDKCLVGNIEDIEDLSLFS